MQVFVTPRAERDFDQIIEYLKDKWGDRTANQFIQKADSIFSLLKKYPLIGPVETGEIRGFQLTPHTRIFYRIRNEKNNRTGLLRCPARSKEKDLLANGESLRILRKRSGRCD